MIECLRQPEKISDAIYSFEKEVSYFLNESNTILLDIDKRHKIIKIEDLITNTCIDLTIESFSEMLNKLKNVYSINTIHPLTLNSTNDYVRVTLVNKKCIRNSNCYLILDGECIYTLINMKNIINIIIYS